MYAKFWLVFTNHSLNFMPLEIVLLFYYFQFPIFDNKNNNVRYAQSCEVCKEGWWFLNEGMSDFNRHASAFEYNWAFWFVSCSCQGMMKFCHKNYVKKHVLFFSSVVGDSCWITMNWRYVWKQNVFLFCILCNGSFSLN